jgi:hypothetical protein
VGLSLKGFRPSPELTAKVAAMQAQRKADLEFRHFCDGRIEAISAKYRALSRAAIHAEGYLRSGISDPYINDLAWSALERFITFENKIEREGLADPKTLRAEWSKLRAAA